jgi:hypothetical protein
MMKRIKYVSRFARPLTEADIQEIAEQAASHNARKGLTGVLVTTGRMFLQVLEGPTAEVDALYDRILADDRHQDVLLLSSQPHVTERLFPDWYMPIVNLDRGTELRLEPLRTMLAAIIQQRETTDLLTGTLERAIWRELTEH